MIEKKVYYFAYGSNMYSNKLSERIGEKNIKEEKVAVLKNYRLVFNKKCRLGACANIVPMEGEEVWGVLYKIPEEKLSILDRYEGYPKHYSRKIVEVETVDGERVKAWTYIANPKYVNNKIKPSGEYLKYVVAGAVEHNLPLWYILYILSWLR